MAKLVDLLAKYLVEWPVDKKYPLEQDSYGNIYISGRHHDATCNKVLVGVRLDKSSDFEYAVVTYKNWIAARDRLHAETVKDMREPTNADTDQALWDKVAVALAPAVYSECCKTMDEEGYPENWREGVAKDWILTVDTFMAERAKRLKGGV